MPPAAGRGDNPYHAALLRRLGDLRGRVPPAGDGGVVLPRTRAAAGGGGGGGGDDDAAGLAIPDLDVRALRSAAAAARDWALVAANGATAGAVPGLAPGEAFGRAAAAVDAHTFAIWPNAGTDAWNAHTVGLATLATIRDASRRGGAAAALPADVTVTAAGCNLALSPRPDVRLGTWADALLRAGLPATDVAAAAAACPAVPDGQTLADAGLGGPRGRYGRVMTVLAGRDVTADGAGRPGPQTYAGAVVAAAPGAAAGLPLEAALLAAYPLLWTEPAAAGEGTWRTPAAHVAPPPPAPAVRVVVGRAVGGLAASHGLGRVGTGPVGGPAAPGWAARQLWVSLPDRLVGVLSVGVAGGGVDDHDDDGGGGAAAFGVGVRLRVGAGVLPSGGADGGGLDTTLRPLPSSAAVGGVGGRAWRLRVTVPAVAGGGNRTFTLLHSAPRRGGSGNDGGVPPSPAVDVAVESDGHPRRRVSVLSAAAPGGTTAAITSTLYDVTDRRGGGAGAAAAAAAAAVAAAVARRGRAAAAPAGAAVAAATAVVGVWVAAGTLVHSYTLADNRHYAFYFVRRVLAVGARRAATVLVYGVAVAAAVAALRCGLAGGSRGGGGGGGRRPRGPRRVVAAAHGVLLAAAGAAVLVPTPLMEGRYLGPPVIMWGIAAVRAELEALRRRQRADAARGSGGGGGGGRDACDQPARAAVRWYAATVVYLVVVNGALLWVFLERPFARPVDAHMPSDTPPGRFML
ncbi:hypothetical protein I4F81_001097 [Pyropia yezoensis]|uniref:Uncharacterized protein n=1 Tax=Pyropia yezoensis TaxID=2788 RepID=A0ACC3BKK2_PYRYE|nr:hypothetical protein I4F81_001097 [Neopyropia yezoensis]